ncbi:MAG: hypothetical protein JWN04_1064 [Myxococcaceae bacterium]|nr:hypothetical protein [Myxococcaceae bacterium]
MACPLDVADRCKVTRVQGPWPVGRRSRVPRAVVQGLAYARCVDPRKLVRASHGGQAGRPVPATRRRQAHSGARHHELGGENTAAPLPLRRFEVLFRSKTARPLWPPRSRAAAPVAAPNKSRAIILRFAWRRAAVDRPVFQAETRAPRDRHQRLSRPDLFHAGLASGVGRERSQNLQRYPLVLLARYSSDALRRSVHEGKGRLMKTNRLFALGLMTAVASGACGDDSGSKTTPVKDGGGTMVLPDGAVVPANDGGGTNGSDGGGGNDGGAPSADGGGQPSPGSLTITQAGGTVTSADGNATVTFSRGAFKRPTKVTVATDANPPAGAVGAVYTITPTTEPIASDNGVKVLVTLKYTTADLGGGSPQDLRVGQYLQGKWVEINPPSPQLPYGVIATHPDPSKMTITAQISVMGPVALLGGICRACPVSTCTAASGACTYTDQNGQNPQAGKCVAAPSGSTCFACVPSTDDDNDGYPAGNDCNNNDPAINSGEPELCNGLDDNCNSHVDEGCNPCKVDADCKNSLWYCNAAGFCDACNAGCEGTTCLVNGGPAIGTCHTFGVGGTCSACYPACDTDFDGSCADLVNPGSNDCDPNTFTTHPGAPEICGNGVDDNCDSFIDELCGTCVTDSDCSVTDTVCLGGACVGCSTTCDPSKCTYNGTPGSCEPYGKGCMRCINVCDNDKDGACQDQGDCDNNDPTRAPGLPELCGNSKDDNCNGHIDEGCSPCKGDVECPTFQEYCNADGACDVCQTSCDPSTCRWPANQAVGVPTVAGACVSYGKTCSRCGPPMDLDGDGYVTMDVAQTYLSAKPPVDVRTNGAVDCKESDPTVYPGAPEICGNMIDEDCDQVPDDGCVPCETSAMCSMEICDNHR